MEQVTTQMEGNMDKMKQGLDFVGELRELVLKLLKNKETVREEGEDSAQGGTHPQDRRSAPHPSSPTFSAVQPPLQPGLIPAEGGGLEEDENVRKMMLKRVELPYFDGNDPVGWVARAEQFFNMHHTRTEMKTPLSIQRKSFEFLASLKQEGTMEEYIEQFERLVSHIAKLPDEQYLGYFLNGLNEEIKRKVTLFEPRGISKAMDLAKLIEAEAVGETKKQRTGGQMAAWGRNGGVGLGG